MSKTDENKFPQKVSEREKRRLDAEKQDRKVWFGLGMFGMVGWSITVPAVAATFLGIWLDARRPGGYSWTLMLFMAGLGLGCYNAWFWLQRERREITGKNGKKNK
jgi:ATP synthase protein I